MKGSRSLTVLGLCLVIGFLLLVWPGYMRMQDVQVSDPLERTLIQESKNVFELTDRCDPLQCLDHFQAVRIERLTQPLTLTDTGAAGITSIRPASGTFTPQSVYSYTLTGSRVIPPLERERSKQPSHRLGILESSERLKQQPMPFRKYVCRTGDYLVMLMRRNLMYIPIETIRLCYHMEFVDPIQ